MSIDLNAGIYDGHKGPVSLRHTLKTFDELTGNKAGFTREETESLVDRATIPPSLLSEGVQDAEYEDKKVLIRRQFRLIRLTIFNGEHEIIHGAGLHWLEYQQTFTRKQ